MANKYSRLKIFHYKEKLDNIPLEEKGTLPPLQIRIKPTNICKHNCWYCAYKAENLQLGKDMQERDNIPKEKMMQIIDDCASMGVRSITFSGGGDPFHYPYLEDTLLHLKDTSIKFATLTHGALLKGNVAKLFKKYGSWVRISIDGYDDESYAKYRGVKVGEFSKVIQNMKDFVQLEGNCILGIVIVIDKQNYTKVYEMAKMFYEIGVNNIKMSPCIVSNEGKVTNDYHKEIYDQVKEQILKVKQDFASEAFEIFDAYHKIEEKFTKEYEYCPYIQICPVIGADCNLYACHDKAYNLDSGVIASLKEKSLKEVWFSNKEQFFKIKPCEDCDHHCAVNGANQMILEYLNIDKEHLDFV
jgi:MoaA/NifB/PqqE/SkfB family radical SAM enzyme